MKAYIYIESPSQYIATIDFKNEIPQVNDIINFDNEIYKVVSRVFQTNIKDKKFSKNKKYESSDIILYVIKLTNNYINGKQNKK